MEIVRDIFPPAHNAVLSSPHPHPHTRARAGVLQYVVPVVNPSPPSPLLASTPQDLDIRDFSMNPKPQLVA